MGNNLCKERIERADNPKSSVDRIIGRCAQICPSSGGKTKSNYWQKHVLETRAPTSVQPKPTANGEWRSATLQPNSMAEPRQTNASIVDGPIAPPRRKRASLLFKDGRPGGFKDVFGNFTRRSSIDSALSFDRTPSTKKRRNSSSDIHSDEFCDFSKDLPEKNGIKRKISKVGNKKSDRFFGENLSDCLSATPINGGSTPLTSKKDIPAINASLNAKDDLDAFVENNVTTLRDNHVETIAKVEKPLQSRDATPIAVQPTLKQPIQSLADKELELNANLDKKAEFLMAMLEGYNKEEMVYDKHAPVVEPLIVPKRKHGRHICDDEEKLKLIFQTDERKAEERSHDTVDGAIKSVANIPLETKQIKQTHVGHGHRPVKPPPSTPTTPNDYENMQPIEEPIIVPRRVVRKHICDDDEHMHNIAHSHRSENLKKLDAVDHRASPKKPDRDFARYRKSLDLSTIDTDSSSPEIERPVRRKEKSLSRESLPSPPPRPIKSASVVKANTEPVISKAPQLLAMLPTSRPGTPPPADIRQSLSSNDNKQQYSLGHMYTVPNTPDALGTDRLATLLKKCNSTHSFLTPDLMDQILNKVNGFKMNWEDHESTMYGGYDDCSGEVAPSSKLKTRKISTIRKEFTEKPIFEEVEEVATTSTRIAKPLFSIGDTGITKSEKKPEPAVIQFDQKETSIASTHSIDDTASLTSIDSEMSRPSTTNSPPPDAKVIYSITKPILTSQDKDPVAMSASTVLTTTTDVGATAQSQQPACMPVASVTLNSTKIDAQKTSSTQPTLADTPLTKSPDPLVQMIKRTDTILEMKPNPSAVRATKNDLSSLITSLSSDSAAKDMTGVLEDIYSHNKSILGDFHQYLEDANYTEKMFSAVNEQNLTTITPPETQLHLVINKAPAAETVIDDQDEQNEIDDDDIPMTPPLFFKRRHQRLFSATPLDEADLPIIPDRRGSIVDHDQWFLNHSGTSDIRTETPLRRGSECLSYGYDTRKLYPFGRRDDTLSVSSEFFEEIPSKVLSKSSDHINLDGATDKRDLLEHSTLLKFFDTNKKP